MELRGIVKWFDVRKGYGFITDEEGMDYFVHYSEIQGTGFKRLRDGQKVSFLQGEDERGRCLARMVSVVEETDSETDAEMDSEIPAEVSTETEMEDRNSESVPENEKGVREVGVESKGQSTETQEKAVQAAEEEGSENGKTKSPRARGSRVKAEETA